jgi:hypothetical protein
MGMGPNPISWEAMRAWADLTGRRPSPPEVSVLRAMDQRWLETSARLRKEEQGEGGAPEPANDSGPGGAPVGFGSSVKPPARGGRG